MLDPSLSPPSTLVKFFGGFWRVTFKVFKEKPKNCPHGTRGGSIICLPDPTTTPSVVLNSGGKIRRTRRGKIPKIVATFVLASSQGQRKHHN
jgi:hypothetical protein